MSASDEDVSGPDEPEEEEVEIAKVKRKINAWVIWRDPSIPEGSVCLEKNPPITQYFFNYIKFY